MAGEKTGGNFVGADAWQDVWRNDFMRGTGPTGGSVFDNLAESLKLEDWFSPLKEKEFWKWVGGIFAAGLFLALCSGELMVFSIAGVISLGMPIFCLVGGIEQRRGGEKKAKEQAAYYDRIDDVVDVLINGKLITKNSTMGDWKVFYNGYQDEADLYHIESTEYGISEKKLFDAFKAARNRLGFYDFEIQEAKPGSYDVWISYKKVDGDTGDIIDWFSGLPIDELADGYERQVGLMPFEGFGSDKVSSVVYLGCRSRGKRRGEPVKLELWEWSGNGAVSTYAFGATGLSGSGKGVVSSFVMLQLAHNPLVQFIVIDPNGQDGNVWKKRAAYVALGAKESADAIRRVYDLHQYRTEESKKRGWNLWKVSRENPIVFVNIDEVAVLKSQDKQLTDLIAEMMRATRHTGIVLWCQAQDSLVKSCGDVFKQTRAKVCGVCGSIEETGYLVGSNNVTAAPLHELKEERAMYFIPKMGRPVAIKVPKVWTAWDYKKTVEKYANLRQDIPGFIIPYTSSGRTRTTTKTRTRSSAGQDTGKTMIF